MEFIVEILYYATAVALMLIGMFIFIDAQESSDWLLTKGQVLIHVCAFATPVILFGLVQSQIHIVWSTVFLLFSVRLFTWAMQEVIKARTEYREKGGVTMFSSPSSTLDPVDLNCVQVE